MAEVLQRLALSHLVVEPLATDFVDLLDWHNWHLKSIHIQQLLVSLLLFWRSDALHTFCSKRNHKKTWVYVKGKTSTWGQDPKMSRWWILWNLKQRLQMRLLLFAWGLLWSFPFSGYPLRLMPVIVFHLTDLYWFVLTCIWSTRGICIHDLQSVRAEKNYLQNRVHWIERIEASGLPQKQLRINQFTILYLLGKIFLIKVLLRNVFDASMQSEAAHTIDGCSMLMKCFWISSGMQQ